MCGLCGEEVQNQQLSFIADRSSDQYSRFAKQFDSFLENKILLLYSSAIRLLAFSRYELAKGLPWHGFDRKGVPTVAQQVTNPTSIHEEVGWIHDLAQCVKDPALL